MADLWLCCQMTLWQVRLSNKHLFGFYLKRENLTNINFLVLTQKLFCFFSNQLSHSLYITSWSTQLCLGFLLSALSLCFSVSPLYLSIFLFLPSISPLYLLIFTIYLSFSPLCLSLSLPPTPTLFPDEKFPTLGPIPSFRSKFGDYKII
jgi:hypothetical protein